MREMRAVIYARVACATEQTKRATVSQLEALREHAVSSGMKIIEEFTDEGYSGLQLDRPGLDRIRDLAEHRGFDVLLTRGPDRLARNFALQALVIEELERCGVRTVFLDREPADDRLSKRHEITGAVGEFEQARVSEIDRPGCFPAREANFSVAQSPGSGQRDFHSSTQGGE